MIFCETNAPDIVLRCARHSRDPRHVVGPLRKRSERLNGQVPRYKNECFVLIVISCVSEALMKYGLALSRCVYHECVALLTKLASKKRSSGTQICVNVVIRVKANQFGGSSFCGRSPNALCY